MFKQSIIQLFGQVIVDHRANIFRKKMTIIYQEHRINIQEKSLKNQEARK